MMPKQERKKKSGKCNKLFPIPYAASAFDRVATILSISYCNYGRQAGGIGDEHRAGMRALI